MDQHKLVYTAAVFLAAVTLGSCHCPATITRDLGNCSFQYTCYHDVTRAHVPSECQLSNNYPVDVKVVLHNPTFNENHTNMDTAFIRSITFFKAYGRWPYDNLTFVEQMDALKELHLVGNNIERITGYPFFYLYMLKKVDLSHNRLSHINTLFQIKLQPSKLLTLSLAHNKIEDIPGDAFDKVTSLEELDLSYNSIRDLDSNSFGSLIRLKQLNLAFNQIDSIPDGTFDNVTSLEGLDLSNNYISKLNNNTFSSMPRLTVLKLTNNKIIDLDGAINSLKLLEHLYLRGNQIQNLDMQSLQVIYHLETFDVSGNNLENMASDVLARDWPHFNIHSKFKIILSDNYLVSLPNATSETLIGRAREVEEQNFNDIQTELDLSNNSITNIEFFAFRYILHLTSLDLSRNRLTDFVVHADDLKHVKLLNLSNNYIRNLNYESFLLMDHLVNLDLSFNQLENVPDPNFINIKSMPRYVNMSVNNLVNVNNLRIKFHNKGGVLDLSNNSLSVVNIPHGQTLRLLQLVLRSNNIEDPSLVELRQQDELKLLDMSKNYIKDLNEASLHLPLTLEILDLTYNEIMNMTPSVFKDLRHLRTLRLSHNFLNRIEYGVFQSLSNLENLDLSYNDINILDSKVFTDLKSLQVLSVRYNGMYYLDYKSWVGHKYAVRVNMDGNSFDCQWLAAAISDYTNGISMIEPAATEPVEFGNNLKGISCVQDAPGNYMEGLDADRTLLVMTSKILKAIEKQNKILEAQQIYHPGLQRIGSSGNEVK
ncbi:chaoptin-like [Cydia strobilella]|uniref:chaoptin-like n=1 Tax=Cydia strobilella TaxID=1100964 RepID=UPI003004E5C7